MAGNRSAATQRRVTRERETRLPLRRLPVFLRLRRPLPARREPVHPGAVREGALGGGDVLELAGPRPLRRRLERPAVRDGGGPRQLKTSRLYGTGRRR